ncbi:MAG TPA: glycosyltransferase family 39 protein, partial [Candidatus Eisenbacteria bacterium]
MSRILDRAAAVVAALYLLAYVVIALLRMPYPFDLEWMEGGMLTQVARVVHGQPLYVAPSLSYIPFDYTPLYFLVAALPARLMGEGLAPLRLTSVVCSLGCLGLIAWLVARETRSRSAALLAAGLYAATYRLSGAWLDLARPDSLFLLLVLAGFAVHRADPRGIRGGILAGALFALAFLAKQTALVIAVPLGALAFRDDRRRGVAFAGTVAGLVLVSTLAFDAASHGWYRYYVFGVAMGHGIERSLLLRFWTDDLLRPLALAAVLGASAFALPARDASRPFLAALAAGLLGSAWWLRLYRGSYD